MKTQEFVQLIACGKGRILTPTNVNEIVGKTIYWMFFGYSGNENVVSKSTIKAVMSEFEYYQGVEDPTGKCKTVAERWEQELTAQKIQELKDTLILVDENCKNTYIRYNPYTAWGNYFHCSDIDREVYFILEDEL